MTPSLAAEANSFAINCHGACAATVADIATLRRQAVSLAQFPLPASFLRHVDEQTVIGIAGVGQAITHSRLPVSAYRDWGVIAAPRYQGRAALAEALPRFRREGAWSVSPHLIPHRSLHALSGTVSQALGTHGPNFGVGGAPNALAEALTVTAALLADPGLPGVWLVATGWEPEFVPGAPNEAVEGAQAICRAVVLALTALRADISGSTLRLRNGVAADSADPLSLAGLAAELVSPPSGAPTCWRLSDGRIVELTRGQRFLRNCA